MTETAEQFDEHDESLDRPDGGNQPPEKVHGDPLTGPAGAAGTEATTPPLGSAADAGESEE